MITLTRQSIKSRKLEEKALKATGGRDPDITFKNPSESKGGVFETYIRVGSSSNIELEVNLIDNDFKICDNCEVDLCSGCCKLFEYEDHLVRKSILSI